MLLNLKKLTGSFLIAFLLISLSCTEKREPVRIVDNAFRKVIKDVRYEALFYMARSYTPGSSLAISVKGELVYSEGFGFANTDLDVPATRNTKYRIGELTQILTSLAYYNMVEEGLLSPEDTVQKHLKEFPATEFQVTLQSLIDHTSGLRMPTEEELNWRGLNVSIKRGIETFMHDSLLFPSGAFQYPTMYGYNLMGAIMEEITQEPFPKLIREWVTDTLGLNHTVADNPMGSVKGRSSSFERDMLSNVVNAMFRDLRYRTPSDGYLSTAEDMVKLGNALLYGTNLPSQVRSRMLTASLSTEGYELRQNNGLMHLEDYDGERIYGARGNITGGGSMLIIMPKEEIVVAWLANVDDTLDELPGFLVATYFKDFQEGVYKTREQRLKEAEEEYR